MILLLVSCFGICSPTPGGPLPHLPTLSDAELDACLSDERFPEEPDSQLWHDLAEWAFSQEPEIPSSDEMTAAQAEALLDLAAREVAGLETPEQWYSAGRYFQAENFHGLERPACERGSRIAAGKR